jgi:endo-1,4-beta-xylanase
MMYNGCSRRRLMMDFGCLAAAAWSRRAASHEAPNGEYPYITLARRDYPADSIQTAASLKGIEFGTAVNITSLRLDPQYGPAIARDCGIVVAENEMKMEYVEPSEGHLTFVGADETYAFARQNGMRLRGTTLVWHRGMPDWFLPLITREHAEEGMRHWIGIIAARYRGQIDSWDVVNEITDPSNESAEGLRQTPWLTALGTRYIDIAFHALADVDAKAAGTWNEEDLELDADWMDLRRATVLRTLEGLLKRNVPIKRFGLQSHLNSNIPFNPSKFRTFLSDIASMGLSIEITEFDVDDRAFPADIVQRDRGVADLTRRYLDTVLDEPAVLNILTWDFIDRNTWYNTSARRRRDGLAQRSLPIGADYTRKPMYDAIRQSFSSAPDHSAARQALRSR